MLIVHSMLGSPGASTTALYLAAQWASTGTEVLLIEADPAGGSLGHHLGIHFTPGSASFVASGLPVGGGNLIDHSQDVLLSNLHVMPSTSSPSGAREIARWLDERAEALRDVSASEVAVIIDAGRMSGGALGANLRSQATGVVVVARGEGSTSSLERIGSLLTTEVRGAEVERCVVTIGDSPLTAEEWREKCDVQFCGSVKLFAEVKGDLSAFLNRNKRKAKPWRLSLEEVAGALLPYTKAPTTSAVASQRLEQAAEAVAAAPPDPVAAEPAGGTVGAAGEAMPQPVAAAAAPAEGMPQPIPASAGAGEGAPPILQAPPPVPAEAWTGAASPPAQLPPPFNTPEAAYWQSAPEAQPTPVAPPYMEPTPPIPEDLFAEEYPLPSYAPPPASPPPPDPRLDRPQAYPPHRAQEQPMAPPPAPPAYPPPAHYPPPQPPPPPAHGYAQQPPAPAAPQPPGHEAAHEPPPGDASQPDMGPSGSFRDWASRLYGQAPQPNAGSEV